MMHGQQNVKKLYFVKGQQTNIIFPTQETATKTQKTVFMDMKHYSGRVLSKFTKSRQGPQDPEYDMNFAGVSSS